MYHKRESGVTVQELAKEYKIRKDNIHYLIRLIEKHGEGILRNDKTDITLFSQRRNHK